MLFGGVKTVPAHTSRDFESELRELRGHLLAMGERAERLVGLAFDAFREGAPDAVVEAKTLDAQIDRDDVEIHALILRVLALRQPVAVDLRFLAAALRLITDLERVGDEAVNIAERAAGSNGAAKSIVADELESIAGEARKMLRAALEALVESDASRAEHVLYCDDAVDARFGVILSTMIDHMTHHPHEVRAALCVIRVAKYLERVADHATNVAEEVIFILRGDDVRHAHWQSALGREVFALLQ
jgi:phosphate transport system protein